MKMLVIVQPVYPGYTIETLQDALADLTYTTEQRASLIGVVDSDIPDLITVLKDRKSEIGENLDIRTVIEQHIAKYNTPIEETE